MKKILAMLLAVLMVVSMAACSDDPGKTDTQKVTLTVWTPDLDQGEGSWLENRIAAFKTAHPEYDLEIVTGVCSEGDAGNTVKADPAAAADVYMFANDQLGVLLEAGALAKLGGAYLDQVKNDNSTTFVNTVTYTDGNVYGFPMTNNTWFMYYNKSVYSEEDVKSLNTMLEKGTVAFQMGTAWYTGAMFFGNGCTLFGATGTDASAGMQLGGQAGYEATLAYVEMVATNNFINDADSLGLAGMEDGSVAAMFSGSWDYEQLHDALGDDLGAAALPSFTTSEGKTIQMNAFAGSKAIGVNPHGKNQKVAMEFASFLASEESQLLRYEMRSVTPAHKNLANNESVTKSMVAVAEMEVMNTCSIAQPVIAEMGNYWTPMGTFGGAIINGEVTTDNYTHMVDQLVEQLNNTGL